MTSRPRLMVRRERANTADTCEGLTFEPVTATSYAASAISKPPVLTSSRTTVEAWIWRFTATSSCR